MIFNLLDVQLPNFEQIIDLSPSDSTDSSQSKPIIDLKPKKIAVSHDFQVKYKTEICRHWLEHGYCDYGETCAFAHGISEIRRRPHLPNKYKTKKCKNFHENGYCTYGFRCQFLHNIPKNLVKCSGSYVPILENMENYMIDDKLKRNQRLPALRDMTEIKRMEKRALWVKKYQVELHPMAAHYILL